MLFFFLSFLIIIATVIGLFDMILRWSKGYYSGQRVQVFVALVLLLILSKELLLPLDVFGFLLVVIFIFFWIKERCFTTGIDSAIVFPIVFLHQLLLSGLVMQKSLLFIYFCSISFAVVHFIYLQIDFYIKDSLHYKYCSLRDQYFNETKVKEDYLNQNQLLLVRIGIFFCLFMACDPYVGDVFALLGLVFCGLHFKNSCMEFTHIISRPRLPFSIVKMHPVMRVMFFYRQKRSLGYLKKK
jgi:hypothetical protein